MARRYNLGWALHTARRRLGKSLRDIASLAGVSNAYLCQLEQSPDRLLQISWLNLQRVVQAYQLDREQLEVIMQSTARKAGLLNNGVAVEEDAP